MIVDILNSYSPSLTIMFAFKRFMRIDEGWQPRDEIA